MLSKYKLNQLYFKDTQFANLMTRRIFNVLLIANPYDAFMLEDDGRIDEKIFNEYTSLSLRYPPRFSQVSTEEEALALLENMTFDLVICMPSTGDNDSFDIGRHIKSLYEHIPIVILTPFSHGITARIADEDLSAFDYVFCWLGNTDLLVSIIKLIEDKMNLEHDVAEVGVQLILLVEDGIRFYSSVLPNLYKFVLKQSQEFSTEALNAHQRTLRMRGRPKIVLARTYDEAITIYEKYKNNILGVITDVRFPRVEVLNFVLLSGGKTRLCLLSSSRPSRKMLCMRRSMVPALSIRTPKRWTWICVALYPIISASVILFSVIRKQGRRLPVCGI